MRNQKILLLEQLDRKLKPFNRTKNIQVPERGWIHAIRTTLNMSMQQLGNRLNITKQGVRDIEERESSGSITIKSLREVGNAMDMQLVYGFIPYQNSIEELVELKAHDLAKKIVLRTNQNMKLENQENSTERINQALEELAGEPVSRLAGFETETGTQAHRLTDTPITTSPLELKAKQGDGIHAARNRGFFMMVTNVTKGKIHH